MFLHPGIVHFPEIPMLEILDFWRGDGADSGKLLLYVSRGIWGRRYIAVNAADWCYSLVGGSLGAFHPVPFASRSASGATTEFDAVRWKNAAGAVLHSSPTGWRIDSPAFGDGNWYAVAFGGGSATASPMGPWTDGDNPPSTDTLDADWPRLQHSSSYAATWVGRYVPATTYVRTQMVGDLQVGVPSWRASIAGSSVDVSRTPYGCTDRHGGRDPEYADESGNGFVWDSAASVYRATFDGLRVAAPEPVPGSSWTWTVGGSDVQAAWTGWVVGSGTVPAWFFEIARMM